MILNLPNETLCHIISYLRAPDVERLARTLNSVLTPLCLPFLESRIARARNERRMTAIFGDTQALNEQGSSESIYKHHNLTQKYGTFCHPHLKPGNGFKIWDYLNLGSGLVWLQPVDEKISRAMEVHHGTEPAADEKTMRKFVYATSQLELTLPKGFVHFMTSAKLQSYIPSATACYFSFGHPLLKFKSSKVAALDGTPITVDGYAVRIYRDQQDCYHWYLYMDTEGGHAILGSGSDWYLDEDAESFSDERSKGSERPSDLEPYSFSASGPHLSELEKQLGVIHFDLDTFNREWISCVCADFEEFLARTYFSEWAWFISNRLGKEGMDGMGLPSPIEEYLMRIFSERGRLEESL